MILCSFVSTNYCFLVCHVDMCNAFYKLCVCVGVFSQYCVFSNVSTEPLMSAVHMYYIYITCMF